jgi:hypothetical protein
MQQGPAVVSERGTSVLCSLRHTGQYFAESGQSQQFAIGSSQNHDSDSLLLFSSSLFSFTNFCTQNLRDMGTVRGEKGLNLLLKCRAKCCAKC